jgi:hypothetical protein
MLKKIALTLLVALILIQFISPKKNLATTRTPQHIENTYAVPANVQAILARACYDCHSDSTRYPWYNRVQPVAWWLANHVDEGKNELNFSQFGGYTKKRKDHKLEELTEMVKEGEMPLNSYTWMHGDAKLTAEERTALIAWANNLRSQITVE